jgi:tight adherence protein C
MSLIIGMFVFFSVYTIGYRIYLARKVRLSLSRVEEDGAASAQLNKEARRQGIVLRILLKSFAFLGDFKGVRSLANRFSPSKLIMAGSPLSTVEFVILKILSIVIFTILGYIISRGQAMVYIIFGFAIGFVAPDFWLRIRIKRRHQEIRRDLPMVIDLLNLCVGAGLDFTLAINRVVRDLKKCSLTDELSEVWREMKMGASRREALQHLSRRVNLPELSSFVRTLLQADRLGSPMGEALKIQAEEIRQRRYFIGEEMALKAPIKLLLPLFLFMLPVILIIVAGPVLLRFIRGGGIKF